MICDIWHSNIAEMDETFSENPKRILVVDDSEDNLYLMQFVLEAQGYKVELSSSGKQALDWAKHYHPDLILLDLMMPQMNGDEVIEQLRSDKATSAIPVFLVTANKCFGWTEAKTIGANGVIYKPVDFDRLMFQVTKILSEAKSTKSSANH